ncbi:MAG TPA: DUF885 domain-containing protein [Candidatus Didemnitutus sp.]|nr:DUF885 domain-containing protein [Candidatus Didemnitutus sp.]
MKSTPVFTRLLLAVALTGAVIARADNSPATTESAKANAFFDRCFDEAAARSPVFLAVLGLKQHEDEWDDFSEAHQLGDLELSVRQLEELKRTINFDALDSQTKISYRMFEEQANLGIEGWKWRHHSYVFTQLGGMHADAPAILMNFHSVANVDDARAYIARLNGFPKMFDQLSEGARVRQREGILPPKFVFPLLIEACREVISGAPFDQSGKDSDLWADFQGKVGGLKDVDDATKKQLLADGRAALTGQLQPAYEKLIALFGEQEKVATTDDGVWKLPEGRDYYNFALRVNTTTKLSADEIHELGLREVDRIHKEMDGIRVKVGFKGDLAAFLKFIREDPQFYYPTTPEGKAAYMKKANEIIDEVRANLDRMFTVKPKAPIVVKMVEPFRERGSAAAFYEQPSADGTRPGTYYVNTIDMTGLPKYEMESLAHHEGIPGHHMQIAIAQELEGLPKFRKFNTGYTAYVEGWALYTEYMPKEFGFYKDPYSDFGRLADELLRAVRLVVDTGIHAKKWTRQQVMDYFRANTPNAERDIFTETNRYIVDPGQATAYKVGMLKILELREEARRELGPRFDIRAYHDLVLKNGPLPLNILEEIVHSWIAEQKAKA